MAIAAETANIYVQGSPADLERKLDLVWGDVLAPDEAAASAAAS